MIRAVVVDDSPFVCRLVAADLESGGDVRVVGTANSGEGAVDLVRRLSPQVVTLDLDLPGMSGLEALDRLMHQTPTPVVVVSGVSRGAALTTLRALELGAVDFVLKYNPLSDTDPAALRAEILDKVRQAARVKVVRSLPGSQVAAPRAPVAEQEAPPPPPPTPRRAIGDTRSQKVVVVGASTGGPRAVRELLAALPADFAAAVVVVQHVPASFTQALVAQLARGVALPVREAAGVLRPGEVVVAPGGRQLAVRAGGALEVYDDEALLERPSIDATMASAAAAFGPGACGVVLSGMGGDGAKGLAAVREAGGRTLAQDEASCTIASMPAEAVRAGGVQHVGPPAELAGLLRLWGRRDAEPKGG